jgi:uncharacterized protein (TIGR00251 family)
MVPRGGRNAIDGVHDGALRVRVSAAPADGAANAALIDVLSDAFDVPRSAVQIIRGHRSRDKLVSIHGLTAADVARRALDHG